MTIILMTITINNTNIISSNMNDLNSTSPKSEDLGSNYIIMYLKKVFKYI